MTSSTAPPRCEPRFPAREVLIDNSALVRFWKCRVLALLATPVRLRVADQVAREFRKQGPSARAAFERLGAQVEPIAVGSEEWLAFSEIRGSRASTRDLGDDETLAIAIVHARRGDHLPLVTYDRDAGEDAVRAGIVVLDFLDTLAWLIGCGGTPPRQADEIEHLARTTDGWRPAAGFSGVDAERPARQARLVRALGEWRLI